jgi:hypothetical protein
LEWQQQGEVAAVDRSIGRASAQPLSALGNTQHQPPCGTNARLHANVTRVRPNRRIILVRYIAVPSSCKSISAKILIDSEKSRISTPFIMCRKNAEAYCIP